MRAKSAFTLIEMLVVLALAALMAAMVTVSLVGSYRASRTDDIAGRISNYDHLSREYFRKFGRSGSLVFDLGRSTVTRLAEEADQRDAIGGALHLPSEVRFDQLVTVDGAATSGQVSIRCSADGQTPSYALRLTDGHGKQDWIVTAGLTGKTLKVRDEQEVRDIFRAISDVPSGDDAR